MNDKKLNLNQSIDFIRILIYAAIVGLGAGAIGTFFTVSVNSVIQLRVQYPWLIYFLPFGGVIIVLLYQLAKYKDAGTDLVIQSIHSEPHLPVRVGPLIFVSSVITHLFGGSAGREGAALQIGGSVGSFVSKTLHLKEEDKKEVLNSLQELGAFNLDKEDKVGASIGDDLKKSAIYSLGIGAILIVLYITLRFEFSFAIGGILSLLHDIIIAVGFIALMGYEVDTPFIAAILTILGYSINDTIVIYDRIRENLKRRHTKNWTLEDYLRLDDSVLNTYFAHWQIEDDAILSDLADRFINRRPFKSVPFNPVNDVATIERMKELVQNVGYNTEYYTAINNSYDLPYDFYRPDSVKPRTQIELMERNGNMVELSIVSSIVSAISGRVRGDERLYFPREMFAEGTSELFSEDYQEFQALASKLDVYSNQMK